MDVSNLTTVPGPPHDPTFWLLNSRAGWRAADRVHVEMTGDGLTLEQLPATGRSLSEKSGSFGGVTLPANVAVGPDGSIFLLDREKSVLKRFDPCECRFDVVPCLGGARTGPPRLRNAQSIGICGGNLFICDSDKRRLSVFALRGFVVRNHWSPPPTAPGLTSPWKPVAVAFDGRGRVFVADSTNNGIHRFLPSGSWEKFLPGFGTITHIAIDCNDHLYVLDQTKPGVARVVDADGKDLSVASRVEELAQHFPRTPFPVDAEGNLDLSACCVANGVFDLNGNPVESTIVSNPAYQPQGTYLSEALDSKLYRCKWHRIVLRGRVPVGSRVLVQTYTAEVEESTTQIQNLPDELWETQQQFKEIAGGDWDCLVRNGGGRFLWLRLKFTSKGAVTPSIESIRVEFPRVSLRRFMPAVFGAEPVSADFTDRFLSIFDTTLRSVEEQVDQQARLFDPMSAPANQNRNGRIDFLTWLGTWIGVTLDRHIPEAKRRRLLKHAAQLFHLRGTREGLWRQLLLLLDFEPEHSCCPASEAKTRCSPAPPNCQPVEKKPCGWQPPPLILEHFQLRRWLFVGSGRLGDQAMLWGKRIVNRSQLNDGARLEHTQLLTIQDPHRDPFHYYAHKFTVFVPARIEKSERQRKALENLLQAERPAHTKSYLEFVAPRFRVGVQSMIGLDSVIGRYPTAGVTLNQSPLGGASVLSAPPYQQGTPSQKIGETSRIGTTTKLE